MVSYVIEGGVEDILELKRLMFNFVYAHLNNSSILALFPLSFVVIC